MGTVERIRTLAAVVLGTGLVLGAAAARAADGNAPATAPAAVESKRAAVTAAPAADPTEEAIQKIKHPVEWFSWGAEFRFREEFMPNVLLNQEDRNVQRYRGRLWATVSPVKDVDLNIRLVTEPRHFSAPDRVARLGESRSIDEWTLAEVPFDRLNVQWRNVLGQPLTLTIGRQDFLNAAGVPVFGNGWLIWDGTPLDGSRTAFFDAVRGTYEAKAIQTTFDLIYICQQVDHDDRLPVFCYKDYPPMEQDEQGVIAWVTNKSLPHTQIDGYFIYKHDEAVLRSPTSPGVSAWSDGDNADLYTFGARLAGDLSENWRYNAQYAAQFGNKDGHAHCAQAFTGQLAYFFNDRFNNNLRLGYEYLSGDRPGTGTDEQFDPLWGRWPQWSELLFYTMGLEHRTGEYTNYHRVNLGWSCNPCKNIEWKNDYNLLFRDQKVVVNPAAFDNGCLRGQLLSSVLKYKVNDHVSTHLWGEVFFPGDFYSEARNEVAAFLRFEIVFTW